jgi:DNA invertase Pin-like site-specific DNA recombinase
MSITKPANQRITRCAIYTRKSTEHGLDMAVTSLEAQRDVCRAYIKCQAHRNWVELPREYDDGGYSGGSLERPALQRLIADVEAGRVDNIVIYKIDRLTRSLTDFVRLIDVLDRYGASFVSVTQTFDTSDSMGRLVLNVLLTFAQFERELMSDRVRDKKAAMRRKGIFAGGLPPMGYLIKDGKLVVDPERADWVREMFRRYPEVSGNRLVGELRSRGCVTRRFTSKNGKEHGGQPIHNGTLLQVLRNPIYAGYIVHRGEWIKAESEALVSREQWDLVQETRRTRFPMIRDPNLNFLLGLLHDEHGRRMKIQRSGPGRSTAFRYYKSEYAGWSRRTDIKRIMVDADRVEELAKSALKALLVDRAQLIKVILSLGLYSDEISRLLRNGQLAARRLTLMDRTQLRHVFLALTPRAEVTRSELRLYVSCHQLSRYLAWDGIGLFDKTVVEPARGTDRVHVLHAPAFLICGHPIFALPIQPRENSAAVPNPSLLDLLQQATSLRECVLANRTKSIRQLAREKGIGQSFFARLLRLNYLAPDIQAAIVDGTQPPGLTRHMMLYSSLPLDWEQQRQLMGFN